MAQVIIKGLEKTQANLILMLFEEGKLSEFLNDSIKERFKGHVSDFDEMPDCNADDDDINPQHQIDFR